MTVDTNLIKDSMMNHGKDALSLSDEPKTPRKKKVCFEDFKILKLLGRLITRHYRIVGIEGLGLI